LIRLFRELNEFMAASSKKEVETNWEFTGFSVKNSWCVFSSCAFFMVCACAVHAIIIVVIEKSIFFIANDFCSS
jgi:hypothetical protein